MTEWVSIPEYAKRANCSIPVVQQLIKQGHFITSTTDGGHQVRIKVDTFPEIDALKKELDQVKALVKHLCEHLGATAEQ